jgi:hypothetical protein
MKASWHVTVVWANGRNATFPEIPGAIGYNVNGTLFTMPHRNRLSRRWAQLRRRHYFLLTEDGA